MASKPDKWLGRDLVQGPFLRLCTTQAEFDSVMRRMKVPTVPFLNPGAHATCHHLNNGDNELACVVCIRPLDMDPIAVCALLTHEAVHVFQEWCITRGERDPSREFEAYSIQGIAQSLMTAYREQVIDKP